MSDGGSSDIVLIDAPQKLQLTKEGQLDPAHLIRTEVQETG